MVVVAILGEQVSRFLQIFDNCVATCTVTNHPVKILKSNYRWQHIAYNCDVAYIYMYMVDIETYIFQWISDKMGSLCHHGDKQIPSDAQTI